VSERRRRLLVSAALTIAFPLAVLAALSLGSVPLPVGGVLHSAVARLGVGGPGSLPEMGEIILWSVRLPRVLIAALVGGGLAVVGAALQSLFRNPLADAGLLGVGPGAALLALLLIYAIAHVGGRPTLSGLLLTGLAVSALAAAGTSVLLVAVEEYRVRTVLFWLAGGLEGRGYEHLALAASFVLPGSAALLLLARPLDLLSLGEEEAAALSLPVHAFRILIFGVCALVAGPVTAVAGAVPFVGLVAPHALRAVVGPLGRHLLPASFLAGAVLVVVADIAARSFGQYMELPLGSVTAFVGAPYFLVALRGQEGRG
jgi:iron complex transport system permease protein